jgi:hypothetical protein
MSNHWAANTPVALHGPIKMRSKLKQDTNRNVKAARKEKEKEVK